MEKKIAALSVLITNLQRSIVTQSPDIRKQEKIIELAFSDAWAVLDVVCPPLQSAYNRKLKLLQSLYSHA